MSIGWSAHVGARAHGRRFPLFASLVSILAACAGPLDGAPRLLHNSEQRGSLEPPIRVLLLGDSISLGYTPSVIDGLAGEAEVLRPLNPNGRGYQNCQGTNNGVARIEGWLEALGADFDVVHFNFGLHDLKRVDPTTGANSSDPTHPHQADPERYGRQLREITGRLHATGAILGEEPGARVARLGVSPERVRGRAVVVKELCAELDGFSLHAAVRVEAQERSRLEHLCRYIARPPFSNNRLSFSRSGKIVLALRAPFRDGTTHFVFEPLAFLERLAALVPPPRMHQLTYHGVLAPGASWRGEIVPFRGKRLDTRFDLVHVLRQSQILAQATRGKTELAASPPPAQWSR